MTDALADDLLLTRLEEAFAPETDSEPTEASVAELRRVVATTFSVTPPRPRLPVWTRVKIAAAALIGTTALGAGVAFAAGAPLPGPLRSLAHGLGLPVDSPAVAATRHAEHSLERVLHAAGGAPNPAAAAVVARDATNLSHHLAGLGAADRNRLGPTPVTLLLQARQLVPTVSIPSSPAPTSPVPTSSVPTASTVPPTTTTPPTTLVPPITLPKITVPGATVPGAGSSVPPATLPKL